MVICISFCGCRSSSISAANLAHAKPLGPVISSVEGWDIHKGEDSFEGTVTCTATSKEYGAQVQISSDGTLFINMRGHGGVQMSRVRYNDSGPHRWNLHGYFKPYKSFDIFSLAPSKWQNDSRVRIQILTLLKDTVNFDLSVPEAKSALLATKSC